MTSDAETLSVYDQRASDYLACVADADQSARLSEFIAAIPKGGRVLDLGCGPGHCAATMQRTGLVVDATDASAEMARLSAQHIGINVAQTDFDALDARNQYHGIWASFSLLHAPKSAMTDHLAAIHRALLTGGTLVLGMKLGEGEKRDSLGRFYAYYTSAELDVLLTNASFRITHHKGGLANGLAGDVEPYIVITAIA